MYPTQPTAATIIEALHNAPEPPTQLQLAGHCQTTVRRLAPVLAELVGAGDVVKMWRPTGSCLSQKLFRPVYALAPPRLVAMGA